MVELLSRAQVILLKQEERLGTSLGLWRRCQHWIFSILNCLNSILNVNKRREDGQIVHGQEGAKAEGNGPNIYSSTMHAMMSRSPTEQP